MQNENVSCAEGHRHLPQLQPGQDKNNEKLQRHITEYPAARQICGKNMGTTVTQTNALTYRKWN